jgi:hypothetical protein
MTEIPEKSALGHVEEKKRAAPKKVWQTARSLKPGEWLSFACAQPQSRLEFTVIRDEWKAKFVCLSPTQEQWDALINNFSRFSEVNSALYLPETEGDEAEPDYESEYIKGVKERVEAYVKMTLEAESD